MPGSIRLSQRYSREEKKEEKKQREENAGNWNGRKRNFADDVEIPGRRSLERTEQKREGNMLILFKIRLNDLVAGQRT